MLPLAKLAESTAGAGDACIDDVMIGHLRDGEGYKDAIYDRDGAPENVQELYTITVPAKSGDLYFTSESYF